NAQCNGDQRTAHQSLPHVGWRHSCRSECAPPPVGNPLTHSCARGRRPAAWQISNAAQMQHPFGRGRLRAKQGHRGGAIMKAALIGGIGVVAGSVGAAAQDTQTYPNQTVRIIVNLSPGSVADLLARTVAEKLSKSWNQQVIVDNRPGLAGTAAVAKSA